MMTSTVTINSSERNELCAVNPIIGAALALVCAFIPFFVAFGASNLLGWGCNHNPLAYTALGNTLPAMLGLGTVAIGVPLAVDMHKRSSKEIAVRTATLFSVLGVLVSFTM